MNGDEQCDDGNSISGDGCSATCMSENQTFVIGTDTLITSSTVTFHWAPVDNVISYRLSVGTSMEAMNSYPYGDIFFGNVGLNTSHQVTGIPVNGQPIYVRLWWQPSSWEYETYEYQTQ